MNNSGKISGCLLAVIIFLIIVIITMAAVFFIFFLNSSGIPDVDEFISEVESSERTTDNNSSIIDVIKIKSKESGVSEISIILTNADLTALANDTADSNKDIPFESLLINCNADETIDVTGVVTDLSIYADAADIPPIVKSIMASANGKRIYITLYITHTGGSEFDIDIQAVKIGKVNIPMMQSILDPITDNIAQMLKDQLDSQENFELKYFKIEENQLSFIGIINE